MADGDGEYRTPTVDYRDYEKDPDNYVKVRVDIPGLKKKGFMSKEPANADINLAIEGRSLDLTVTLTNGKKQKFLYKVKQLPDPVLPVSDDKKTYTKVNRHDEVIMMLHKETPRKWDIQLSSIGLETEGH